MVSREHVIKNAQAQFDASISSRCERHSGSLEDGALFAGVTPCHPVSLVTTITLALSVLVAYQSFTRWYDCFDSAT